MISPLKPGVRGGTDSLKIGKAGEHFVCFDLILKGYIAFQGEQGLPFDVLMMDDSRSYKIQVKSTMAPVNMPSRKNKNRSYLFSMGYNGNRRRNSRYKKEHVDIFALVALDRKTVAYIPYCDAKTTMMFRASENRGTYYNERGPELKKKIKLLQASGLSCRKIAADIGLKLSSVYRYSSVKVTQNGYGPAKTKGRYFDGFTIEKCLKTIASNEPAQ